MWFKNRRAKCRQQVKQNQQHHNGTGSDKTTSSRNNNSTGNTGNNGSKSSGKTSGGGGNASVNNNNKMSPTINGGVTGGGVTSSTAGNSPVSTGTSLSSSRQSPPGGVSSYIKPILSGTPPIQPPPAVYHPSSGKLNVVLVLSVPTLLLLKLIVIHTNQLISFIRLDSHYCRLCIYFTNLLTPVSPNPIIIESLHSQS